MVNLGDVFPNFSLETTHGNFDLHTWLDDSLGFCPKCDPLTVTLVGVHPNLSLILEPNKWAILFSHPADYTPVCTTELGRVAQLVPEFQKRAVKLIAISCDTVESHKGWISDIQAYSRVHGEFPYPIISDANRELAIQLGMVDAEEKDSTGMPLTCRAVFVIGPDKTLKLSILYPATTGRNFDEILRVIDALQLTAAKKVATPVDWMPGQACMVLPSVKEDELETLFPRGVTITPVPSGKKYLRMTPQP